MHLNAVFIYLYDEYFVQFTMDIFDHMLKMNSDGLYIRQIGG